MTGGIRLLALLAFAALSALVAFSSARDTMAAPPPYNAIAAFCIEQFESGPECDGDPAPGGSPDVRTKFCIGWGPDGGGNLCAGPPDNASYKESNSGGLIGFTPTGFELTPGAPIGAIGGVLTSTAQLGLLNGPCDKKIDVKFTLLNASVDPNDVIEPKTVGEANVMEPLAQDNTGNGIPDGVDKMPVFLRNNFDPDWDEGPDGRPNYGEASDDVPGPTAPVAPIARLGGFSKIQGNWISLHFLLFKPGDVLPFAGDDLQFKPELGYPLVTVLQDPTVPPSPLPISDFCAPLRVQNINFGLTRDNPCTGLDTAGTRGNCPSEFDSAVQEAGYPLGPCDPNNNIDEDRDGTVNDGCPQINAQPDGDCGNTTSDDGEDSTVNDGCPQVGDKSEGGFIGGGCSGDDEGGCTRFKLPAQAGNADIFIVTASQRDADSDGHENSVDVCAFKANPDWKPRVNDPSDADNDGLPEACDPAPTAPSPQSPLSAAGGGAPNRSCFDTGIVGGDEDQDCYSNRQDNCPLHDQQDLGANAGDALDNRPVQTDTDEDAIGDACDVSDCNAAPSAYKGDPGAYANFCNLFGTGAGPGTRDGERATMCLTASLAIGSPPALTQATPNTDPNCYLAALIPGDPTADGGGPAGPGGGPGTTGGPGSGTQGGGVGGPASGIGSLSPVGASVPAWAAIIGGLGTAGVIGSLGVLGSRFVRRRD
jgi:hypothetical protein